MITDKAACDAQLQPSLDASTISTTAWLAGRPRDSRATSPAPVAGPGSLPLSFLDSTEKPPKALQKQMQDSEAHAARLASAAGLMGAAIDIFLGERDDAGRPGIQQC